MLPADTFYPGINIPSNPKYLRSNDGNDNQISTNISLPVLSEL
jgi:hypothetical protein